MTTNRLDDDRRAEGEIDGHVAMDHAVRAPGTDRGP